MIYRQHATGIRVFATLVFCTLVIQACATGQGASQSGLGHAGRVENTETAAGRSRLVARDLVNAMIQLRELDPVTSTLLLETPGTRYGDILSSELQRAGYDLREGAQTGTPGVLSYTIKSVAHVDGPAYEFGLEVQGIKLRRQYRLMGSAIKPASSMFVFGAAANGMVVDDSLFESTVHTDENRASEDTVEAGSKWSAQSFEAVPGKAREMQNLYETRESNYRGLLKKYDDVRKIILVFGNDSIILGEHNKRLTREIVAQYNEKTDLLSVVGCSHGNTSVAGKNRALALGRSSRVREELILSGVNPGHVLDEGCWDSRHFDEMMPRRGVVLILKREREAS